VTSLFVPAASLPVLMGSLYADAFGRGRMSKSTVSRVTQQLNHALERWRRRELSGVRVVHMIGKSERGISTSSDEGRSEDRPLHIGKPMTDDTL
jgi:hypothetical protein